MYGELRFVPTRMVSPHNVTVYTDLCPHKVRVIYVHTVHTRTHAHTQSCRKCSVLTAGFTAAYSCLGVYLVLIWSIFGLGSHMMMIIIIKSMILVLQYWLLSFTFFFVNSILHPSSFPLSIPAIVNTVSISRSFFYPLSLSHSLSLCVCLCLSLSLWARGTAESAVPVPSQGGIEG